MNTSTAFNYATPNPSPAPNPFASLLNGFIQGGAGQVGMQQQQAAAQQQQQMDLFKSIAPAMINQGRMIAPVDQGTPGSFNYGKGAYQFNAPDYSNPSTLKPSDQLDLARAGEQNRLANQDPDQQAINSAFSVMNQKAFDITGNTSVTPEGAQKAITNYMTLKAALAKAKADQQTLQTGQKGKSSSPDKAVISGFGKASDAVAYLMKQHGMSQTDATQWLKDNKFIQ